MAIGPRDERDPGQNQGGNRPRQNGLRCHYVVMKLNLILRGWEAYFRNGTSARKFTIIDSYVHQRLAIFDSAKHARTGNNWLRHDRAWLERTGIYCLSRATPR